MAARSSYARDSIGRFATTGGLVRGSAASIGSAKRVISNPSSRGYKRYRKELGAVEAKRSEALSAAFSAGATKATVRNTIKRSDRATAKGLQKAYKNLRVHDNSSISQKSSRLKKGL